MLLYVPPGSQPRLLRQSLVLPSPLPARTRDEYFVPPMLKYIVSGLLCGLAVSRSKMTQGVSLPLPTTTRVAACAGATMPAIAPSTAVRTTPNRAAALIEFRIVPPLVLRGLG